MADEVTVNSADGIESRVRDIKVEYLKTPDKSESDKKDYRVIKLENGLTALLISDIKSLQDETKKEGSNAEDCEKDEKMAACAACINVGSFSDPVDVQGMAHFLEHMVFMGSEKYPEENEYSDFINKNGGYCNAWTASEETEFYFTIQEDFLHPAMDRFAQFFIHPLMKRDAITREREAVDSEFKLSLSSDYWRKEQLFSNTASEGHPLRKFSCGNLISLRDNIDDDTLYTKLHTFRERHYSAHRMTVAVQARLSLDALEQYVKDCFAGVPNNKLPPDDFSEFVGKSFNNPNFTKIYSLKPIEDKYSVVLTWALPPVQHLYKNKPIGYIESVIGRDKKGSLINYLRAKTWLTDLWCPEYEIDSLSTHYIFYLTLELTDEGRKHFNEVLETVFSYINMLRRDLPQERIFRETQEIKKTRFRYSKDHSAEDNVTRLSSQMHYFPPEHYITATELYFEYDPLPIKECINAFDPEIMNIMILDKELNEEELDQTEPWYQIKYSTSEIPKEWVKCWKNIEPLPEFHLPEPNRFIADDFSLINLPAALPDYPMKIHSDDKSEIWYRPDPKFRLPECYVHLQFVVPSATESARSSATLDVFWDLLGFLAAETLEEGFIAGINHSIHSSPFGFAIKLFGRNQKLPLLLNAILKYLADCHQLVDEELFIMIKKKKLQAYYNYFIESKELSRELEKTLTTKGVYSFVEKHAALTEVAFKDFTIFARNLTKNMFVQCLVQGNISQDDVMKNVHAALQSLQYEALTPDAYPTLKVVEIPDGVKYCKVKNFRAQEVNSGIRNYYQSGVLTIENSVIADLLELIMAEQAFDQLRTKEQLGYIVSCRSLDYRNVLAFAITVCTDAKKFSTEHVDERIESFLKIFIDYLDELSPEEFEKFKETLIKRYRCADTSLEDEVNRNWGEIQGMYYIFDRNKRKTTAIENVTFGEFRQWLLDHCYNGKNFKKLSIQVVASADDSTNDSKEKEDSSEEKEVYTLSFLTNEDSEKNVKSCDYITDIQAFKNNLPVYENTQNSITPFLA